MTAANTKGFTFQSLNSYQQSYTAVAPYPLWNVGLPATIYYSINNVPMSQTGSILYDTGTAQYTIYNLSDGQGGIFPSNKLITTISNVAGGFQWSFTTGSILFVNSADGVVGSFPLVANTGNIPFTIYNILYDSVNGRMGFRSNL